MKKTLALLLALCMVLSLAACGAKTEEPAAEKAPAAEAPAQEAPAAEAPAAEAGDKIIRVGASMSSTTNLDAWYTTYPSIYEISDLVFDRLLEKDPETLAVYPSLLTGMPEISEDGLTYKFELKEGVKFHDGTDLTTEDVVYSFNYFLDPEKASWNSWVFDMVAGYSDKLTGVTEELAGITAEDDYHFTMTLSYPFSAFCDALAGSYIPILPSDTHAANVDTWGISTLVGTGPMILESFEPGVEIKLVTNEEYHGNVLAFDGLIVTNMDGDTALLEWEAGNIDVCDVASDMVDYYRDAFPENLQEASFVGGEWLSFNMQLEPLNDIAVRKALCYATDRSKIVDGYYNGNVATASAIVPAGMPGHEDSAADYSFDIELAKQTLAEAGYSDGVTVTCGVIEGSGAQQVFQILQQDWAEAGINLEIELIDGATWTEQRSTGNCAIYMLNWYADYIDPDMFLNGVYNSAMSTFLSTGFADEWFDEQLLEGRKLPAEEKHEFYAALDKYLCSEVYAACPVFYSMGFTLVSDRVEGVIYKGDYIHSYLNATIVE